MANQANVLDPLGIISGVKRQVDAAAAQAQMPAALQPRNVARLFDPLGVFAGLNADNVRPGMARTDRTSTDRR
ncbi:hypothetical protein LCGC14_0555050 [marine sediment metagenome]|uniref:Uncharacterized protein n=1 Tax=marine sediment metagenome TaxID=412755 RepID=A0A0F9RTT2_9ZZZZ